MESGKTKQKNEKAGYSSGSAKLKSLFSRIQTTLFELTEKRKNWDINYY